MRTLTAVAALLLLASCSGDPTAEPARGTPTPTPTPASAYHGLDRVGARLKAVEVPGACGHTSGVLERGELPGIPAGQGYVDVNDPFQYDTGPIAGDRQGVAVVVHCSSGGLSGPDAVAFYDDQLHLVGSSDLSEITGQERPWVRNVWVEGDRVVADVAGFVDPSFAARIEWSYDGTTYDVVKNNVFTGWDDVVRLVAAVHAGDRDAGEQLATPQVYDHLLQVLADGATVEPQGCFTHDLESLWPKHGSARWYCTVNIFGPYESSDGMLMVQRADHWFARDILTVAG